MKSVNMPESDDESSGVENNQDRRRKRKIGNRSIETEKEDEEERKLTSLIFGTSTTSYGNDEQSSPSDANETIEDGGRPLFVIDRVAKDGDGDVEAEETESNHGLPLKKKKKEMSKLFSHCDSKKKKKVWQDDDDDDIENDKKKEKISLTSSHRNNNLRKSESETEIALSDYIQRQRSYFKDTSIVRTDWAKMGKVSQNNTGENVDKIQTIQSLLSSSKPLLAKTGSEKQHMNLPLPPSKLNIVRCKDINWREKVEGTLRTVQFHPTHKSQKNSGERELVLTASMDKRLNFFKINDSGEHSEKVHGIFLKDMPIYKASFLGNSGNVIASGRRPFFYLYDAEAGKIDKVPRINGRTEKSLESFITSPNGELIVFLGYDGYLLVWDVKSKSLVGTLKINGQVRCASFTKNSNELLASGSDGDVYRFDMRSRKCISRFQNEDGTVSSSLTLSSSLMAVGAESGIVNLYSAKVESSTISTYAMPPLKSISNIQTLVSDLKFNNTGDILAISSKMDKNAFRLLHVPSKGVFSNWPTSKTPLGYVSCMDFSHDSKFLAIGNDKGKCLLYKLNHYV